MCVIGVLGCDEVVEEGVILSDICCIVSGRLACLPGSCNDIDGDDSSNRSKTTTLGSDLDFCLLLPVLETVLALGLSLVRLLAVWAFVVDAYSGRSAKLFGVTTTL